ncbi:MAG: phosphoribosyl-ATP diphosphatase [Candidatus Heimdallarchaeota archaeon]|nr:phosphoribosyl-ATP diphosphatase [Candidatus Heimdallarchaeota archaeon]
MIIPSIDLLDGKAVQLVQGKQKVLERSDIENLARYFNLFGEIAVIDLNGSFGNGNNENLIRKIANIADIRVGGGIRSEQKANNILQLGPKKIIIGTQANADFLQNFNPDRVIAAIDSKDGEIVDDGWRNSTKVQTIEKIEEIESYCSEFLYTDVNKEGMLQGINKQLASSINSATSNQITYAGGITSIEDIKFLNQEGMHAQIGMAIYTDEIRLESALLEILDFSKGLIPTIVQDKSGRVRMLAYSSKESILRSIESGYATYYSRSRKELWTKGMTSGNIQKLLSIRSDCDADSLIFTVDQLGSSCHTGKQTCFGDLSFSLDDLYNTLLERSNSNKSTYSTNLLRDEELIKSKILEEAEEVVKFEDRQNLIWELADLQFFMTALMVQQGINPAEVINELWRRRK